MGDPAAAASLEPVPGKCNARKKAARGGGLCQAPAGRGTDHPGIGACSHHLGNAPNHLRAGDREKALAACSLLTLDVPVSTEPAEVIVAELIRVQRSIAQLEWQIALLPLDEHGHQVLYGEMQHASGEKTGEARPHVLWVMWTQERKAAADVAKKAADAGVARRHIELVESIASEVRGVLERFAEALGLDREDPRVREAGRAALQLAPGRDAA